MQVITGKFKGRKIKAPNTDETRPTLGRVKESLFSIIFEKISDSTVLDLFAGSGALGLECMSRGARFCFLVDSSIESAKAIKQNFRGEENYEILNLDFDHALNKLKNKGVKFDLVFIDPPYESELGFDALRLINKFELLKKEGLIVYETSLKKRLPIFPKCYIIKDTRTYGTATLFFLEKNSND